MKAMLLLTLLLLLEHPRLEQHWGLQLLAAGCVPTAQGPPAAAATMRSKLPTQCTEQHRRPPLQPMQAGCPRHLLLLLLLTRMVVTLQLQKQQQHTSTAPFRVGKVERQHQLLQHPQLPVPLTLQMWFSSSSSSSSRAQAAQATVPLLLLLEVLLLPPLVLLLHMSMLLLLLLVEVKAVPAGLQS
jgi:hypothetical protein